MKSTIRNARIEDSKAIFDLIYELAVFEKEPNAVTNNIKNIEKDGFGENKIFDCILAENEDNKIVGMALFYTSYSTWKGRMMHLEDLIVSEKFRGHGFGKLLLDEFLSICAKQDAKVVKWEVLNWNKNAIEFYKKYDVKIDNEWSNCKLYEKQLQKFRK